MRATRDQLAYLFHESGLLDDASWKRFLGSRGGKPILQVLRQDAFSLATYKDFLFSEIRLSPKELSDHDALRAALYTQIRLTENELLAMLKAFRPPVERLTRPFVEAGIMRQADIDAALRQKDLIQADPYEQLMRQNILSAEALTDLLSQAERRTRASEADGGALAALWPYRQELCLRLLHFNRYADDAIAEAYLAAGGSVSLRDILREANKLDGLIEAIQNGMDLPEANLDDAHWDAALMAAFPASAARRLGALPLAQRDGRLCAAIVDPLNLTLGDMLRLAAGKPIEMYFVAREAILAKAAERGGEPGTEPEAETARTRAIARSAETSTVNMVSSIIEGAIDLRATDIHLEPMDNGSMRVRYRIDGRLRNILMLPGDAIQPVVSRIKVLANLDVTERRRPQDGHFDLKAGDAKYDFRISTLPCHLGEKVVIRILDETQVAAGLADLGLEPEQEKALERLCRHPHGMLLATGPTGSGKTSTLYACLQSVNSLESNIVTIEDPVEYQLPGINQVNVNAEIQLGFAEGLRSILRQDPDVIMVGEIRDAETAAIAVRAALTGHLVFSTMHTNTALGAYSTLAHMGVPAYTSSAALLALTAQRLVRRICPACRESAAPAPDLAAMLWPDGAAPAAVWRGAGCDACMGIGYQGRAPLAEVIEATPALRRLAAQGGSEEELRGQAAADGFLSIADVARRQVAAGKSTLEEVCYQLMSLLVETRD